MVESEGMGRREKNRGEVRTNRAAALMELGKGNDAVRECWNVVNVDEENIKALSQAATCA